MARVPSKHGRDQALDFQGFLNDMQDWELSLKDKDKKMKPQAPDKLNCQKQRPTGKAVIADSSRNKPGKYDDSQNYDAISRISSSLMTEESLPDATSEKELGNEYFKQKKFNEAIDCYSRSIALSPTAVAYANRAMAYLKIIRFQEAEDDCTEALNLDDRYIKAYSRRATSRRELGKLKESMEDSEFALRLEPHNQEVKKQYADVKSLYEKEILKKASGVHKARNSETKVNGNGVHSVSIGTQKTGVDAIEEVHSKENGQTSVKKSLSIEKIQNKNMRAGSSNEGQEVEGSNEDAFQSSGLRNHRTRKQELKASVQELAFRAASRSMAEAARNITPPKSAYQFEISWRSFSGDRALQARILKATSPSGLPRIFKNALSAPMLIDIIKCVATFFTEEMDLAVKYLDNLTKVPRFDMLIMCLSSTDKADLLKIWDEVFSNEATPIEYAEILDNLRSKYCLK